MMCWRSGCFRRRIGRRSVRTIRCLLTGPQATRFGLRREVWAWRSGGVDAVGISVVEGRAVVLVRKDDNGYLVEGDWDGQDAANAFLNHLAGRGFSTATLRAYAFDVANLARFLVERAVGLAAVDEPLVFDWIDWQGVRRTDQPTSGRGSRTPS